MALEMGGPPGVLAGKMLGAVLGVDKVDHTNVEQLVDEASTKDPGILLELKKSDADLKVRLGELDIDLEKVSAADRDSARAREIAVRDKTPAIGYYLTTAGFFICIFMLFRSLHTDIPTGLLALLSAMTGVLGTVWIGQNNYYYGSSLGSKAHGEAVADIAKAATANVR